MAAGSTPPRLGAHASRSPRRTPTAAARRRQVTTPCTRGAAGHRRLRARSISARRRSSMCPASPHTYSCSPGTWIGAQGTVDLSGKVTTFTFTWQRLTPDSSFFGGYRIDTVATGQVYRPSAGSAFALAQSWLIRCVVQTSNAAGSTSALSAPRTLSPAPPLKLLNDTTDIRVTGIEVTQAVQEDKLQRMRRDAAEPHPGGRHLAGQRQLSGRHARRRQLHRRASVRNVHPAGESGEPGRRHGDTQRLRLQRPPDLDTESRQLAAVAQSHPHVCQRR